MSPQLKTTPYKSVPTHSSCSSFLVNLFMVSLSWRFCYRIPENNSPGPGNHYSEETPGPHPTARPAVPTNKSGSQSHRLSPSPPQKTQRNQRREDLPKIEQHYTIRPTNKQPNTRTSSTEHPEKTNQAFLTEHLKKTNRKEKISTAERH